MRTAMSHAGVSITVTSITDFVAFMISTSTSLPALSSFCFYAATGILFLFLFQCLFFGAYIVIDTRRQKARRMDCCCCFRVPENDAHDLKRKQFEVQPGVVSKFMKDKFGPFIVNRNVGFIVLFVSLGFLGAGIYGASQLDVESNQLSFIPDGSYIQDTIDANDRLFGGDGTAVSLVLGKFDYFEKQSSVKAIKAVFEGKAHLESTVSGNSFRSWYDSYESYVKTSACYGGCSTTDMGDKAKFYKNLHVYLNGPGAMYNSSVIFSGPEEIKTSRIDMRFDPKINDKATLQVEAMQQMRAEVEKLDVPAYAYTFEFLNWETFVIIEQEMINNVGLW